MGHRVSLAAVLLVAAASLACVQQLPLLASSAAAGAGRGGGVVSYTSTSSASRQQFLKIFKGFLKRTNWIGVALDAMQFLLPLLSPPGNGSSTPAAPPPSSPPADTASSQPRASLPVPGNTPTSTSSSGQLSGGDDNAPAESAGLYYVSLVVGTPPQMIYGVLDISSQFMWMQCATCSAVCLPPSPPAPAPAFIPGASRTFVPFTCASDMCQSILTPRPTCSYPGTDPCSYLTTYDGNTIATSGYISSDIFTFGTTAVPQLVFGCSVMNYAGVPGVIGFGRGPFSLVSQLGLSGFSYLMMPQDSNQGVTVQLGNVAAPLQTETAAGRRVRSTRLLQPPQGSSANPGLYYVGLTGIQVDGQDLDGIPPGTFDLRSDGTGGVVLSTTVPVTFLAEGAYKVLRQALVTRIPSGPVDASQAVGLDLCYSAQSLANFSIPTVTLVFDGVDAAMELGAANYFFRFDNAGGGGSDVDCLTVLPSRDVSVLGSLLQTGTQMIYDLVGDQLTFVMEDAPPPSPMFVKEDAPPPSPMSSKAPSSLAGIVPAVVGAAWLLLLLL